MAVFTPIEPGEAQALVERWLPGAHLRSLEPVAAGIENTNFFVEVDGRDSARWLVLTVFEMIDGESLDAVIGLLRHLDRRGLPVAAPLARPGGGCLERFAGKPVVLVPRLSGTALRRPAPHECRQVGELLGQLHREAADYTVRAPAVRDDRWIVSRRTELGSRLPVATAQDLDAEIAAQLQCYASWRGLPAGWGHQDLFVDNVLFHQGAPTGLLDFYQACEDAWVLDLAVMLNDWCFDEEARRYQPDHLSEALAGYQSRRRIEPEEARQLVMALRLAALRFWLSRLCTRHLGGYQQQVRQGDVHKDPDAFWHRILALRNDPPPIRL